MHIDLNSEQKILEAAKVVFIKKGFDGARMQDIADEAKINKALVHYYYRSKEELFAKIFDIISSQLLPNIEEITIIEMPILDKIERFIHSYIEFVSNNPEVPLFILSEINKNPERLASILKTTENFPKIQQFAFQVMLEMQLGKLKQVNTIHLMLNILSLCIFPFIARPMVQNVLNLKPEEFDFILKQRKQEVTQFVLAALRP
jgi:TetR/AcrR family transcriptional regulator